MIIKKLQYLRTTHRQVPTDNTILDRAVGTYYDSEMQEVASEINYEITETIETQAEIGLDVKQRVVIKLDTQEETQKFVDMVEGNFTYHNFRCKRPNIEDKYIYNYEFVNYENFRCICELKKQKICL